MAKRQLVILSRTNNKDGSLGALGSKQEVVKSLAVRNTAAETDGADTLYGPGIEIELPPNQDPVLQMLLTLCEDEIAWPVIMRLAKDLNWKILDPSSGRELTP